ncbi:MAG: protease-like activity factor CPAF, partial [Bdellovibrionales bacterium]|nr:protease-like activity factor CPAF [Bdellovibrionales bacterium]
MLVFSFKGLSRILCGVAAGAVVVSASASGFYSERALETIDFIENVFEDRYAPRDWKAKHIGWDLKIAADSARARIQQAGPDADLDLVQNALRDLIGSVQDYHVGIYFYATERSTLPLEIRSAEGRFFIAHIDRKKLTEASFPFKVGDEVTQFNGKTPEAERSEILKYIRLNIPETDATFAEMLLTKRVARMGLPVARGPVELEVSREVEGQVKKFTHQLIWDYQEEVINPMAAPASLRPVPPQKTVHWLNRPMQLGVWNAIQDLWMADKDHNPHELGGKKSFLPKLGKIVWENDEEKLFHSYIFKTDFGLLGYVRIPSYMAGDEHSAEFLEIVKKMEEQTDALVIDQVNNPGGSVFYLYSLVAMLTDRPMSTPLHRITITQEEVQEAAKDFKTLEKITNEEEAIKELGETVGGYPVSYQLAQFFKENARFILDQWKSGARLTSPYYLGIDKIMPHPKGHYTKPILILINESDFSGGDFFPAI